MNNSLVKKNNFLDHFDIFLFIQILITDNLILILLIYLEYPKVAEFLNAGYESLIWDEDLPVHSDDVAVAAPDPGHGLVIQITGDRIQSEPDQETSKYIRIQSL